LVLVIFNTPKTHTQNLIDFDMKDSFNIRRGFSIGSICPSKQTKLVATFWPRIYPHSFGSLELDELEQIVSRRNCEWIWICRFLDYIAALSIFKK